MYVCGIVRMPFKRAWGTFFSKKHGVLGLTPVYSETTALSKPYFILKLQSGTTGTPYPPIKWRSFEIKSGKGSSMP